MHCGTWIRSRYSRSQCILGIVISRLLQVTFWWTRARWTTIRTTAWISRTTAAGECSTTRRSVTTSATASTWHSMRQASITALGTVIMMMLMIIANTKVIGKRRNHTSKFTQLLVCIRQVVVWMQFAIVCFGWDFDATNSSFPVGQASLSDTVCQVCLPDGI